MPRREEIAALSAELALCGPVTVLDGGNCFPFYRFARLVRAKTLEGAFAARRLFIRRAFTCYQMLELLESTPALDQPYLVLDPLATFYDEQIPEREVRRLLDACLVQINRLCHDCACDDCTLPAAPARTGFPCGADLSKCRQILQARCTCT
jgi:hypothetical protein